MASSLKLAATTFTRRAAREARPARHRVRGVGVTRRHSHRRQAGHREVFAAREHAALLGGGVRVAEAREHQLERVERGDHHLEAHATAGDLEGERHLVEVKRSGNSRHEPETSVRKMVELG
jgi:hypothetical protein